MCLPCSQLLGSIPGALSSPSCSSRVVAGSSRIRGTEPSVLTCGACAQQLVPCSSRICCSPSCGPVRHRGSSSTRVSLAIVAKLCWILCCKSCVETTSCQWVFSSFIPSGRCHDTHLTTGGLERFGKIDCSDWNDLTCDTQLLHPLNCVASKLSWNVLPRS